MERIKVPTGDILIVDGEHGKLECLSIGDYGKDQNIKADFLGLTKDINGVPHGELLPLSEKWVVTISTQYGCSMNCTFCDVPKVGAGKNATLSDMRNQINSCLDLHPEVKRTERLNVHFARMGEPTWNKNVLDCARWLYQLDMDMHVHPVVSTMMPKRNKNLDEFLCKWCRIKNNLYSGNAGLQLSINSTNDDQRDEMFSGNALSLDAISFLCCSLPVPIGRKYTLNFALADGYEIDARRLKSLFNPEYFLCKITPMHVTKSCDRNGIHTDGGYDNYTPYENIELQLKNVGFGVIVFVPSKEEDESRITCGNAILAERSGN